MRKIVQIAVSDIDFESNNYIALVALCDDGTTWILRPNSNKEKKWILLLAISQDKIES